MRIGMLSDAHGNPTWLSRCLKALRDLAVERVYFLGDATGYLPGEVSVLEILSDANAICLLGNHDAMVTGRLPLNEKNELSYRHRDARKRLGAGGIGRLSRWPEKLELTLDGRRLLLVHGHPADHLEGYCYPDTSLEPFRDVPYDIVVTGHTHRPFIRTLGEKLFINPGSCGLPRDQGNAPSFGVYDSTKGATEIYRLRMNPEEILAEFEAVGVPDLLRQGLYRQGKQPLVGQFL